MTALLIKFLLFVLVELSYNVDITTSSHVMPPAKPSKYASMGKIGQYVGHINNITYLKAAMAACSYMNEIILISTTSSFVDAASQTIGMFKWVYLLLCMIVPPYESMKHTHRWVSFPYRRRFHIAHVLLVSTSEEACKNISSQIPGACCAWEDFEIPPENPLTRSAFNSHRTMHQMRWCVLWDYQVCWCIMVKIFKDYSTLEGRFTVCIHIYNFTEQRWDWILMNPCLAHQVPNSCEDSTVGIQHDVPGHRYCHLWRSLQVSYNQAQARSTLLLLRIIKGLLFWNTYRHVVYFTSHYS